MNASRAHGKDLILTLAETGQSGSQYRTHAKTYVD